MFNKFLNRNKSPQELEGKQGFICPECRRDFASVEELSEHHVTAHPPIDFSDSFHSQALSVPSETSSYNGDKAAQLKDDIADLGASLQEESWYAAELQKELTKVQQENEVLKSSVNAKGGVQLEAVSKKAADLAVLVAQLSAELDEEKGKSDNFGQQLADLQTTNEELCQSQMELQAKLNQSTSTDDVEVLKQELAKSQVQLDAILSGCEKDTLQLQDKIGALQDDKHRLQDKIENKDKTLDKYLSENKTLTSEVVKLQTNLEHMQTGQTRQELQISEYTAKISDLEQASIRLNEEMKRKDEEKNVLFEKFNGFNTTLNQLNTQLTTEDGSMNSEMKLLADNFSDFQSSLQAKENRNTELVSQISTLQTELSSLRTVYATTQTQLSITEEKLLNSNRKISSLESVVSTKDVEISDKCEELVKSEAELQTSSNRQQQVQEKYEALNNESISLRREHEATHSTQQQHIAELDTQLTNLRNDHNLTLLDYEKLKVVRQELETEKVVTCEKVDKLTADVSERNSQLETFTKQILQLEEKLTAANEARSTHETECLSVQQQLALSVSCVQQCNTRIDRKDEQLLELNNKIQILEVEVAKPCTMCANYESQLNKCHLEIQELQTRAATAESKVSALEPELREYRDEVEKTSEKLHSLELDLDSERENAMNTENLLTRTRNELQQNTEMLNGKVCILQSQLEDSRTHNQQLEDTNSDLTKFKGRLEQGLAETERALKEGSEIHTKEMEDLNNKNALLIAHKMQLHEQLQQYSDQQEQLSAQLAVVREQYSELKGELDGVTETHQKELVLADSKTEQLAQQLTDSNSRHDRELAHLTNRLTGLQQELRDSQGVFDELTKECERLHEKHNLNEITIENLEDQKKIIHKRLLESDENLLKLKEENQNVVEEYEETRTALNELAQEHSHLIYIQEKKSNRKWEDDSEVEFCKSCSKEFGVALRKHHCRNCGGIFCDTCTKHKSSTPASKAKVRVCLPCNKELNP